MNTEQAIRELKVLKTQFLMREEAHAIDKAIEVMEKRKDEITKAWIDGHNRLIPFKQDEVIELAIYYYNRLNRPQSETEGYNL